MFRLLAQSGVCRKNENIAALTVICTVTGKTDDHIYRAEQLCIFFSKKKKKGDIFMSAKGIKIVCSNCGNSTAFIYTVAHVSEIASDWGSANHKLLCPNCCKALNGNTDKDATISVINEFASV